MEEQSKHIAFKIPMTAMPELVAGFHSLVGLAAVFVAIAAFLNPAAFNLGNVGNIKLASLIEMSIGAAVGTITFSGSIIAFLKLRGIMSGAPITFGKPAFKFDPRNKYFVLIFYLCKTQSTNILDSNCYLFSCRCFINHTYWWSRYACSNFNAQFLLWMGCSRYRFYIRKYCFDYYRCTCRIL